MSYYLEFGGEFRVFYVRFCFSSICGFLRLLVVLDLVVG